MAEKETNNTKSDAAFREERVLEFWKENKVFEKSLEKESPKGRYIFYDGPPFATGQIHYGHILGSTVKDVIGRYKTMQGFYVPRKWGWDCHGLPIENIVEKELGIAGHKEIEKYGIDKFVEYARSKVLQYDKDWEKGIERIGRWVDFRGQYKTMDNTFIESVWWALSELNKKNLIYEGIRVLAYCPRCETPIANSEIAMDNSYKDISDISVYVKFELEDEPGTYLLAWTTTPWTLPGNTAIAINKNIEYVKVKVANETLILAKKTLPNALKDKEYSVLWKIKGEDIVGRKYKPVFPYYKNSEVAQNKNIWKVWYADFVTDDQGTGIAHEAPAFGEDDMNLAKQNDIPWIIHVDETGRFKPEVADFAGMQVKPKGIEKDDHQKADVEIIKYLAKNNLLFAKEKIIHSYPHCMRCDTPIIYYALPSWFINIEKVKENIIKKADSMNWIPAHLKEGRFKNIVENAPDWNISRNRYWASPLPIWKCDRCRNKVFINSLADLKDKTKKSGNKYFAIRHGEADNIILDIATSNQLKDDKYHLTEKGRKEVLASAQALKDKKIDIVFASPLIRTKETAEIVAKIIGFSATDIIYDDRLREVNTGDFHNKRSGDYHAYFSSTEEKFTKHPPHGENLTELKYRVMEFLYEIEKKYQEKKILIVSHEYAIWMMSTGIFGWSDRQSAEEKNQRKDFIKTGEVTNLPFVQFPHNKNYELDLHRPYIDEVPLVCSCGNGLVRIPEVLDCWFESGSMPFAQDHYPFENKEWQKNNFPAGFVAEYIAQTRTWFYYTHVVSAMLFNHAPFRNIVTTGTLRAEDGEKMSKSKNNYPDPWSFIDKYGVDALRIYLMSSTLMKGEDANFSEKAVQDIASKVIGRLFNVLAFYELYPISEQAQYGAGRDKPKSDNVLDQWILFRFDETLSEITKGMENYDIAEATRPIDLFIDDLSTWYLRRSRERIKNGDGEAKKTLYYVLKNLAKLIAPFAPFTAEDIWLKLRTEEDAESVHLENWLRKSFKLFNFGESKVVLEMEKVRKIVSEVLMARQAGGKKVRQPLKTLKIQDIGLKNREELIELIKDEVNVKEILFDEKMTTGFELDLIVTPELKQEGDYRELTRSLQDMRKKMGLTPSDIVSITFETNDTGRKLIQKFKADMKKTVLVSKIEFKENDGAKSNEIGSPDASIEAFREEIKIDGLVFKITIAIS
ncbi:MAG: Isoleucine-tRNA ligase [Candidatus Nomurabacteria bacterium GW2011_GWA2_41_25]|uniref:isoleucine--tRNA ligase n=1 Tax=Candidatus Nomurabacteria bacterium GW2011_GWA2_41_25 TaxID=1618736 RepID=A0A0G0Y6C4_9BACT|nr:MAG: Isoleucine-tRNA ligase [Candidatus Nomurabacteria bacterium GW2011_GWA2_41_25]OGI80954.1 MAG: hypothetical protein A3D43_01850 [Candidatus Nomurabacteria bacterium RIFCSPHIGHO2_02_FULL_41_52]OGI84525.1 MAG: hypothetical protein A3F49_02945 [Candidatus Nomurabacteria bacterium RIFCSPHIGHO2_12_FULL_42_19]OGI94316.1 MAG: hypothetical protein A3A07_01670 [Candidatus Nomurabacteria bacterium RIFCSPLOWO2_01_FULL_41_52]OGI99965.1 MAG: hypothetical protein A3H56_03465 [Candidatus Nomurabacteria